MIKAIETVYKGYRFRSRLEARWAVFFDTLGVKWEYEKEGFDLGKAGWYLPDFWLPQQQVWVEIKGNKPTDDEKRKCFLLADGLTYPVVMFWGAMGYDDLDGRPEFQGEVFLGFHPPNPKCFPNERSRWDYHFGTGDNNLENFLQKGSATMSSDGGLPVKIKTPPPPPPPPLPYELQENGYTVDYSLNGRDWIIHLIEMETHFFKGVTPTYSGRKFGMRFDASPILKNGVLIFDYDYDRGESVRFAINAACSARFEHKKRNIRY